MFIKQIYDSFLAVKNRWYNKLLFRFKNVSYADMPMINGRIRIFKQGRITFGKGIKINSGENFNPIGGDLRTVFSVAPGATLKIGNFTGISNSTIICRASVQIGNNVNIGGGTKIYDTDFHSLEAQQRANTKTDIGANKPIIIKDHAFVGAHSIILKGVTIGKESVVGAGSVVTKSIPDKEIWGGNPAKFIRRL